MNICYLSEVASVLSLTSFAEWQEEQDEHEEQFPEQLLDWQAALWGQPIQCLPSSFAFTIYATAPPIIRTVSIIAIISPGFILHRLYLFVFIRSNILGLKLSVLSENKEGEKSCEGKNY